MKQGEVYSWTHEEGIGINHIEEVSKIDFIQRLLHSNRIKKNTRAYWDNKCVGWLPLEFTE